MILSRKINIPFASLLALFGMLVLFTARIAFAIPVSQDVTLKTTNGADVTMLANSSFDELIIGGNTFTFTLSGTQTVNLRDSDAQVMNTNVDGVKHVCNSENSELTLDASKATSFIVTMEGFACSSGGGGGSNATSPSTSTDTTTTTTTDSTATTEDTTATDTTTATEITTDSQYLEGAPPPTVPLRRPGPLTAPSVIVTAPGPLFPAITTLSRGLTFGSEGNDVRALQEALASMKDVYPEGLVTGYYGALTKTAVAKFQMKYGIVSSSSDPGYGYVGPMTRAKLAEVFGSAPVAGTSAPSVSAAQAALTRDLDPGDSGNDVTQLQVYLAADAELYPEGKVTGYYGSLTTAAVKRFQARYGIAQVGRVGPQTRAKLNEVMGGGTTSQEAALQQQVQDLQSLINSLQQQIQSVQY